MAKARDLFCVPPNHTPHFTLADDSNVIVLPDFLPLVREREVLIFRWTPDTPRSSLRRSIGQPIEVQPDAISLDSRGNRIDESSNNTNNDVIKSSRGVRWDESVVSNEEKNKQRHAPRPKSQKEARDSAASRQRAEYVKQKIQEQEELRQREEEAEILTNETASTAKYSFTPSTSINSPLHDPFVIPNNADISVDSSHTLATTSKLTQEDLLVSGSSPPSYSSPTPKLTSHGEEEQQTSSPLASPTRDIRGARKTDHSKAWMMGLGAEKHRQEEEDKEEQQQQQETEQEEAEVSSTEDKSQEDTTGRTKNDAVETEVGKDHTPTIIDLTDDAVGVQVEAVVESKQEDRMAVVTEEINMDELEEEAAVEQATSPQRAPEINFKDIPSYQTMKSVVNQLRSHPSNQTFRQPCSEEFSQFCQERNRPVIDLFTISNCIVLGKYGVQDPLKHFKADLDQMWNNIRTYYAPQSQESQSAGILDTFGGIILEEWKRSSNAAAARSIKTRPNISRAPYSTPMSRVEKHHVKPSQDSNSKSQQQALFASLVAKSGKAPLTSPLGVFTKSAQNLKRPAPANNQKMTQGPAKKQNTSSIVLVVNNGNSKDIGTSEKAPRAVTRGIATRRSAI